MNVESLDPYTTLLVKFFNEQGLTTTMSCQGHNKTNQSMFWIQFDSSITTDDIIRFQRQHLNEYGNFCSCGRFVIRILAFSNDIRYTWEYMAATIEAASEDYRQWA